MFCLFYQQTIFLYSDVIIIETQQPLNCLRKQNYIESMDQRSLKSELCVYVGTCSEVLLYWECTHQTREYVESKQKLVFHLL